MEPRQIARACGIVAGIAVLAASGACNRAEEPISISESQSQDAQATTEVITARGCLKAGTASDTFVLTAARTEGSQETATYQLVGTEDVDLEEHVGRRVEIRGTVDVEQEAAARTTAVPPAEDRPTGTTGTPTVQTEAELDLKRLSVSSITAIADRCE